MCETSADSGDLVRDVVELDGLRDRVGVEVDDVRKVYGYFMDEKRSVQWLKEQQGQLVFEEIGGEPRDDAMDTS